MAVLIPDEKCLVLKNKNFSRVMKNTAGYDLGPVPPSAADGATLGPSAVLETLWDNRP